MLEAIYHLDIQFYIWIRTQFFSPVMESIAPILASPYGWTPFLAMIGAILVVRRPDKIVRDVFFAACAFVVSYQISHIISLVVRRKSPQSIQQLLEANGEAILMEIGFYSFPDWASAAMAGVIVFVWIRMKNRSWLLRILSWFPLLMLALSRIYQGDSFPLDIIGGMLMGMVMGIFASRIALGTDRFSLLAKPLKDT